MKVVKGIKKILKRVVIGFLVLFILFIIIGIMAPESNNTKETSNKTTKKETTTIEETTTEKATEETTTEKITEEATTEKKTLKKPKYDEQYWAYLEEAGIRICAEFSKVSDNKMKVMLYSVYATGGDVEDSEDYYYNGELIAGNNWVSKDKKISMKVNKDGSITIKDKRNVSWSFDGDYRIGEFEPPTEYVPEYEFIASSDFRNFIGQRENIGKTIKFEAEVGMTFDGEYLLYVYNANKQYQIRSNIPANAPLLYDGDKVLFTGTFNGNTPAGNQLSFTTVDIKLK